MNAIRLAIGHAHNLLPKMEEQLRPRAAAGDEAAIALYCQIAQALAAVAAQAEPGVHGELLTTAAMASRLGISSKTLLRRRAQGLTKAPIQLGHRGRAALRWRGDEVAAR